MLLGSALEAKASFTNCRCDIEDNDMFKCYQTTHLHQRFNVNSMLAKHQQPIHVSTYMMQYKIPKFVLRAQ